MNFVSLEEIERVLQSLIGEPLSGVSRPEGSQLFEFGRQPPRKSRKGQAPNLADPRLRVLCGWRISGPEGESVSSDYLPLSRDEKAYPFYEMLYKNPPLVQSIAVDGQGGFTLRMTRGYTLTVLIDERPVEPGLEQWRFLPKAKSLNHFIFNATE